METVAERELTVVLSSHLIPDIERVCDYLIVLADSRVRLAGDLHELLGQHHRLVGPRRDPASLGSHVEVIEESHTDRQSTLVVRTDTHLFDPAWTVSEIGLEDLVLAYLDPAVPGASSAAGAAGDPRGPELRPVREAT